MEEAHTQRLLVALGYVRALMREVLDEATRHLESGLNVFERNDFEDRKGWARARIETLTADIKKLGAKPMPSKERTGTVGGDGPPTATSCPSTTTWSHRPTEAHPWHSTRPRR